MCHEGSKLAIVFKHFSNILHTRLAVAGDKVYQLLAHGRWFSPGTSPRYAVFVDDVFIYYEI
jgi:hypothetical protein